MQSADRTYSPRRVDIFHLEAAELKTLLANVPDCYKNGGSDTLWGYLLRAVAIELAKLEKRNQYLLQATNPDKLNPADLKRVYADALRITRSYPASTQFDSDYRTMILELLAAYRKGGTLAGIQAVINAYTGSVYPVQEIYPLTKSPADRHSLQVGVSIAQSVDDYSNVGKAQSVVQSLYTAIDLAKPAHVGVSVATTIRDEDMAEYVLDIDDSCLRIIFQGVEDGDPEPMLALAPIMNTSSLTGLAPSLVTYSYQWYRNGVALEGATSRDLPLASVSLEDDGAHYHVVISDPALGSVTSNKATLTVSAPGTVPLPKALASVQDGSTTGGLAIVNHPMSRSVVAGSSVVFTVTPDTVIHPGIISPHINTVWEMESDTLISLDI